MARIIVIFSAKGGVGKTLVATNLAVSMASDRLKRVCLVDLDLQVVGDMARMLGLKPQSAMVDLIGYLARKGSGFQKEDFVTRYSETLDFIPGVLKPQLAPHFEADRLKDIFSILENHYEYIIVDAGQSFNDVLISALNQAHLILLVVTPDILSVYQAQWALETLQTLHFPLKMVKIILNRAQSASSINWEEISTALSCEIIAKIPSEGRIAMQAVNQGVPIVIGSSHSKFAWNINKVAGEFISRPELFIEHSEIGGLKPQEAILPKSGEFWDRAGLTEDIRKIKITTQEEAVINLKQQIHQRLIDELDIRKLQLSTLSAQPKMKELKEKAEKIVGNLLVDIGGKLIASQEVRRKLVVEIIDEALGLGPLEDFLRDESITDIMVNNKDEIYIERNGKLELTSKRFISNEQVKTVIERIIAPLGRRIDESAPMVDARLPDGSRVNAIIPPLSLTGPSLTIRKFRKERFKIEDLIKINTLNAAMSEFLQACVVSRKNIIVSGGTGSGKTSVLNVLSEFVPENERIISIEDAAELKLHQYHWIRLESRPPNIEGKGAITIRELFRNTLRMRPDRILIGECRSIETMDMLQAMNTGHDGSMTTIHANSTHDVLTRLDSMILMSGVELPIRAIREMIASAIDVIVHTARLSDGSRKVIQITEIAGMLDEMHVDLKDIFVFRQTGVDSDKNIIGDFHPTGYIPTFTGDIRVRGITLSDEIFKSK